MRLERWEEKQRCLHRPWAWWIIYGNWFGSVPGMKAVWGNRLNPGSPNGGQWAMGPCPEKGVDGRRAEGEELWWCGSSLLHVNEKSNVLLWESLQIRKCWFSAQGSEHRGLSPCVAFPYSHQSLGWCLNYFLKNRILSFYFSLHVEILHGFEISEGTCRCRLFFDRLF